MNCCLIIGNLILKNILFGEIMTYKTKDLNQEEVKKTLSLLITMLEDKKMESISVDELKDFMWDLEYEGLEYAALRFEVWKG